MNIAEIVLVKYKTSYQEYLESLSLICKTIPPLTMQEVFTLTDEELLDRVYKYFLTRFTSTTWEDDFGDLYGPCELLHNSMSYMEFTNREKQMMIERNEFQYRY